MPAFDNAPQLLILIPMLMGLALMLFPARFHQFFAIIAALFYCVLVGKLSVPALMHMDFNLEWAFQALTPLGWAPAFRLDSFSAWFVMLGAVTLLVSVSLGGKWFKDRPRLFTFFSFFLLTALNAAFLSRDLLLFYVFFEAVFIPTFFMMGIWGGEGKATATLRFVIMSLLGSLFMLISIILLGWQSFQRTGSFNLDVIHLTQVLGAFSNTEKTLLFAGFFMAFAIKVPLVPFHSWLPDAYVAAPTPATIWLSAVMSKLGIVGFVRFALPLFQDVALEHRTCLLLWSAFSIIYAAFLAWRQTDMKRMLAYSSVSHLGFVLLGVFSLSEIGTNAAVFLSLAHGITSAALFAMNYFMEQRESAGGMSKIAPKFSVIAFFLVLGSVALPGTANFVGEFLVLKASFDVNKWAAGAGALGVIFGAVYMLNFFQHKFFGTPRNKDFKKQDIQWIEFLALAPALVLILVLGFNPNLVFRTLGEGQSGQSHSAR